MKKLKGSIRYLVVNLRCSWCKELFPWKPRLQTNVEQRLPEVCSGRCRQRLSEWRDWQKIRALGSSAPEQIDNSP